MFAVTRKHLESRSGVLWFFFLWSVVTFTKSDCNLSTLKVTSAGTKTWSVLVGSSSWDYGYAVEVDSARNAYVVGSANAALPGATHSGVHDGCLIKYDKDGVQQWLIQFGTGQDDEAMGLQIDSNDMLFLAVQTRHNMEGTNLGGTDMVVMQVDSTGSVLWTEQFGTNNNDAMASGNGPPLAIDSTTGDLFIAANTYSAFDGYSNQGYYDWFLYKIDAASLPITSSSTTSSASSSTSSSITATLTTSSSTTSDTITLSTTSTSSSSNTGTVTSTSTSSRTLAAVAK